MLSFIGFVKIFVKSCFDDFFLIDDHVHAVPDDILFHIDTTYIAAEDVRLATDQI